MQVINIELQVVYRRLEVVCGRHNAAVDLGLYLWDFLSNPHTVNTYRQKVLGRKDSFLL